MITGGEIRNKWLAVKIHRKVKITFATWGNICLLYTSVHRLDKDTTGLMVVAKTIPAQTKLVRDLQKRKITREYEAVASGIMTKGGTVEQPMACLLYTSRCV